MQQLKHIKTVSLTPGSPESISILPGRYVGLTLRLTGTTDTSQTLALSEIGSIRLQRDGRQIQSGSFEFYHDIADLLGGFPEATLATAGATAVFTPVFFSAPGVPNSMEVVSRDELILYVDPLAGLATEFGSNTITLEVHGIVDELVPERYELQVAPQNFTASAAVEERQSLNAKNLAYLALNDSGGVITSFQFEVDGKVLVSRVNDDVYKAFNNLQYKVEASGMTQMLVPVASGNNPAPYLNEKSELEMNFSGAGTVYVTLFSIMASPTARKTVSQEAVARLRTRAAADSRAKLGA